ncbi:N-acetylglucosamine ABC transporter membrane protein /chitobiose ABC transporter membrane protein [Micromonospora pallida]|uniref:N-acetylglucosamine ABC transporter membrane protein /chitobiose ABC transporter membrane protein n=1 Tax=Micromonospora pallida TaxID=145854 RepID=A0A1C6RR34_9ACTN|nr:sugar ABC transporter permease [Micromonospora pallida]SCL19646.1 N-acetylglucosamine ABC transporter membrane protein /chitobiose ABC transporter membrane protein [Micromonospora pallida]
MRHGRYPFIVGFLAAPVAIYVTFVLGPYAQAFYLATTNWRGVSANPEFIGLENFTRLLDDDVFWKAIRHHGLLLLALPLLTIALALFFAFLLNVGGGSRGGVMTGVWGSRFYRVVFFFPQVLAVVIVGVIFSRVYAPDDSGLLNGALGAVGIDPVLFMADPDIALWSIIAVLVWQAVGFYVVLFSAGMSSVPKDIYEAAIIDGAGRAAMFFRVTLPLLWDTLQVAWVYLGIAAFDAFAIVQVLSVDQGGPDGATTVLGMEIYRNAFSYSQFGYASAMGVALFFLTITFAALTLRVSKRDTIEL